MFKQNILDAQEFGCQDVLSCWQGILIWSDVAMTWHDHYVALIIDDYVWPLVMDETFFPISSIIPIYASGDWNMFSYI